LDFAEPMGVAPQTEKIYPGPIWIIMQNFTPISVTVADISVTNRYIQLQWI